MIFFGPGITAGFSDCFVSTYMIMWVSAPPPWTVSSSFWEHNSDQFLVPFFVGYSAFCIGASNLTHVLSTPVCSVMQPWKVNKFSKTIIRTNQIQGHALWRMRMSIVILPFQPNVLSWIIWPRVIAFLLYSLPPGLGGPDSDYLCWGIKRKSLHFPVTIWGCQSRQQDRTVQSATQIPDWREMLFCSFIGISEQKSSEIW